MEEQKLNITVRIAERKYMLLVYPSEEACVRKAAEYINNQIQEMSSKYAFKDRQDIFTMISLVNTTKMLEYNEDLEKFHNSYGKRLTDLDEILDKHLSV